MMDSIWNSKNFTIEHVLTIWMHQVSIFQIPAPPPPIARPPYAWFRNDNDRYAESHLALLPLLSHKFVIVKVHKFFFKLALLRRASFWPPFMVYISVIIAHNKLNFLHLYYSNHLNTEHLNTRFIWIPDSMGVQYSNGKVIWLGRPFEYRTCWTVTRLFSVRFSDHHSNSGPFDNWTQIHHLNTRIVRYSDGYYGPVNS